MLLGAAELTQALESSEWRGDRAGISRELRCRDFLHAVELINRVAELAERENHHPDILLHGYRNLRLTLSTHSQGGVTEADIALSRLLDALLA